MIRKRTLLIALTVLAVSLTSCSASRSESEDAEGSVLVVENSSELITSTEAEMADEVIPSADSQDDTLGEVNVLESDEEADNDESDIYLKEIPPFENTEITLGDTSYKDELTDQLLIDEADSLFDQGYLIIGADTLAKNGACLTYQEGKYFYRGFLAANGNLEVPELRYYYILPEDLLWEVIDTSSSYVSSYTMSETKIEFELVDENETLVYNREQELLIDISYR